MAWSLAIPVSLVCALLPGVGKAIVAIADVELEGQASAVQVRDGAVFVATDAGLEILDLSEPRAPQIASLVTPSPVREFALDGDLAYLACDGSLRIVDVSDPSDPHELGHVDTPGVSFDVAVAADHTHVFVSTSGGGLRIIDASDPEAPVEITSVSDSKMRQLTRIGDALFGVVVFGSEGLHIGVLDVSDPAAPVPLPSIEPYDSTDPFGQSATVRIGVDGERLWVLDETQYTDSVVRRFDVTTPAVPELLDTMYPGFGVQDLSLADDLLHTVRCFVPGCRVVRFDVADSSDPETIGELSLIPFPGPPRIAALGERAYLADGNRLRVVDFSHPEWPRALDTLPLPASGSTKNVHRIERVGDLAYVAADTLGLHIVDVSDPEHLVAVGQRDFNGPRRALDLALAPPIALVADPVGLRVATVANPFNPYMVADPPVSAWAVEFAGGLGYSASGTEGLVVWDVAEPTTPEVAGSAAVTDARDVAVADGFAYVLGVDSITGAYELVVVDIANPAAPDDLGRLPLVEGDDVDVEVRDSIAYVAIDAEVYVVDVSSPAAPLPLGSFRSCGSHAELEVRDNRLLVAGAWCGLAVFDLTDPLRPFELGLVSDDATSSQASGRIAILGTTQGVLKSFDLGPEYFAPEPGAVSSGGAVLLALAWAARRGGRVSIRR